MIEYLLTRSSRKTIGITVKDGKVFVRAPKYASKKDIDNFVLRSTEWINRKLSACENKESRFADYTEYRKFLYRGKVLDEQTVLAKRLRIENGTAYIPAEWERSQTVKAMASAYKRQAEQFLEERLSRLASACGFVYEKFMTTNARTKWGSCSSDGTVRLNWRLILLPDGLIDYVIVHELCHTKQMNHSREFWDLVSKFIPDVKQRRKTLKSYSPLIETFR